MRPDKRKTPSVEPLESKALLATIVTEKEPNDRLATADIVSFHASQGGTLIFGAVENRRDNDFFRVDGSTTGMMTLKFRSTRRSGDIIDVKDVSGNVLLVVRAGRRPRSVMFPVMLGQDFVLRVRGSTSLYLVQLNQVVAQPPPILQPMRG